MRALKENYEQLVVPKSGHGLDKLNTVGYAITVLITTSLGPYGLLLFSNNAQGKPIIPNQLFVASLN